MDSPDLVTVSFVEVIYGLDAMDDERAGLLISLASDIVREYSGASWDSSNVPAQIKLVVAQMVGDAYTTTSVDASKVKAEQIGDYRVEYANVAVAAMSVAPYVDVLNKFARR